MSYFRATSYFGDVTSGLPVDFAFWSTPGYGTVQLKREMKILNPKRVLMHLALGVMNLLRNKSLELMTIIHHPLEELEKKTRKPKGG